MFITLEHDEQEQGSIEEIKNYSVPMGDCRCGMEPIPNLVGDKKEINRFSNSKFYYIYCIHISITGHGWYTSR